MEYYDSKAESDYVSTVVCPPSPARPAPLYVLLSHWSQASGLSVCVSTLLTLWL